MNTHPLIYNEDPPLWKWIEVYYNDGSFDAMVIANPAYKWVCVDSTGDMWHPENIKCWRPLSNDTDYYESETYKLKQKIKNLENENTELRFILNKIENLAATQHD